MSVDASSLFEPFQLGDMSLPNRVVMAPLSRNRVTRGPDVPNDLIALYYRQRASAGLIVSEAMQISQQGQGYAWTPGIYTPEQIDGWRKVTAAVHAGGGRIVAQLWHVGRISHTSLQPMQEKPVAPSAIVANAMTFLEGGFTPVSEPRALDVGEISGVAKDFRTAAENAKAAGFDGLELHGANGYLIEQFLKSSSNRRTDRYGGSVENRSRFALEVAEAMISVFPASRVGIRLAPVSPHNDVSESEPQPLYNHLVRELGKLGIGFIHMIEGSLRGPRDYLEFDYQALRKMFPGAYIANNGYTRELAVEAVSSGRADMVAFGRPYISNPDLVERLRIDAPLNEPDASTFYCCGANGYTDYPTMEQAPQAAAKSPV
jgi:N-ethylmaleimide reductase